MFHNFPNLGTGHLISAGGYRVQIFGKSIFFCRQNFDLREGVLRKISTWYPLLILNDQSLNASFIYKLWSLIHRIMLYRLFDMVTAYRNKPISP